MLYGSFWSNWLKETGFLALTCELKRTWVNTVKNYSMLSNFVGRFSLIFNLLVTPYVTSLVSYFKWSLKTVLFWLIVVTFPLGAVISFYFILINCYFKIVNILLHIHVAIFNVVVAGTDFVTVSSRLGSLPF